jgi:hypothetical protein
MARNLTYDHILAMHRAEAEAAIASVPEFDVVELDVPAVDGKGKPKLDADGIPTLVKKRLLKRDLVRAQWADKLKPHEERAHDQY